MLTPTGTWVQMDISFLLLDSETDINVDKIWSLPTHDLIPIVCMIIFARCALCCLCLCCFRYDLTSEQGKEDSVELMSTTESSTEWIEVFPPHFS